MELRTKLILSLFINAQFYCKSVTGILHLLAHALLFHLFRSKYHLYFKEFTLLHPFFNTNIFCKLIFVTVRKILGGRTDPHHQPTPPTQGSLRIIKDLSILKTAKNEIKKNQHFIIETAVFCLNQPNLT